MEIKTAFRGVRWGEKALVCFCVSILSGVIVSLQYDPAAPFYSVSAIDTLIPFGSFFRALHFYSSQLFFLLSLLHLLAYLINDEPSMQAGKWTMLIASVPVSVLLLFTGYILRADATGESAGFIAENIALSVPIVGKWLNAALFSISAEGMKRVYANHLIGLGVLWVVLCRDHVRRFRVNWIGQGWLVSGILLFSLFFPAPMEVGKPGLLHIPGPWFFLGLQELLRYVPPFWAGIIFPISFFIALCLVRFDAALRKRALIYSGIWVVCYTVLTCVGAFR